jgi:hypothetical protein
MVFDIAREVGMAGCFFSFNEYNMRYVDGYVRLNDPANFKTSFCDENGQWWSKAGRKIHPFIPHGPINLKHTKQWIIYHLWDSSHKEHLTAQLKSLEWNEES